MQRAHVLTAYAETGNNVSKTARRLGVSRNTIYRTLRDKQADVIAQNEGLKRRDLSFAEVRHTRKSDHDQVRWRIAVFEPENSLEA